MARVLKFLLLPGRERLLLVQAAFLLVVIRIGLSLVPFRTLRRLLARLARADKNSKAPRQSDIDRVIWALKAAGRTFPPAGTCLTEALAGYVLLGRRGYSTDLRIGVTRDAGGRFLAHAWLEKGDLIVIGQIGAEHERYMPFPAIRGLGPF